MRLSLVAMFTVTKEGDVKLNLQSKFKDWDGFIPETNDFVGNAFLSNWFSPEQMKEIGDTWFGADDENEPGWFSLDGASVHTPVQVTFRVVDANSITLYVEPEEDEF